MALINELAEYTKRSILTPLLSQDPVYQDLVANGGVEEIISNVFLEHGLSLSATSILPDDRKTILLSAKKEIYFRLATNVAPEFDIEERYTKILRGQRFDHYMKLWDATRIDLKAHTDDVGTILGESGTGNLVLRKYDGISTRNYTLAREQGIVLAQDAITNSQVDLSWTPFDYGKGTFAGRHISIGTAPIYDPYASQSLYPQINLNGIPLTTDIVAENVKATYLVHDVHRNKYRIKDLTPSTKYYLVLRTLFASGLVETSLLEVTTTA